METDKKATTQDDLDARARELARRVMGKPAEPQQWPKKPKPPERQSQSKAACADTINDDSL